MAKDNNCFDLTSNFKYNVPVNIEQISQFDIVMNWACVNQARKKNET